MRTLLKTKQCSRRAVVTDLAVTTSLGTGLDDLWELLLRRESGPFKVDDTDLKKVEIFARLAALVLHLVN